MANWNHKEIETAIKWQSPHLDTLLQIQMLCALATLLVRWNEHTRLTKGCVLCRSSCNQHQQSRPLSIVEPLRKEKWSHLQLQRRLWLQDKLYLN